MKYKVTISPGGKWQTEVLDPQRHKCNSIVSVVNSFGQVNKVEDKKDDVPVKNDTHVRGGA